MTRDMLRGLQLLGESKTDRQWVHHDLKPMNMVYNEEKGPFKCADLLASTPEEHHSMPIDLPEGKGVSPPSMATGQRLRLVLLAHYFRAQLPLLAHERPDSVVVIDLGTAISSKEPTKQQACTMLWRPPEVGNLGFGSSLVERMSLSKPSKDSSIRS